MLGMTIGGKAEKGVDGGQAGVACADGVGAIAFEVIEEAADECGVEIGQVEVRRLLAGLSLGVGEQEAKGVPVGVDRVWAGVALLSEPGCEKGPEGSERAPS